jgi:uncharacterized membrane protein
VSATIAAGTPVPWWLRLHQALMPDYNRKATVYWWTVVALGMLVLAHSARHLAGQPATAWLHAVSGTLLAMLAGLVPVRIPRSTNSFTAGEIFIFLLLLLNGPEAAALASACEAAASAAPRWRAWQCSLPARCCMPRWRACGAAAGTTTACCCSARSCSRSATSC